MIIIYNYLIRLALLFVWANASSITYNPFDSYSNAKINSIYGTGNRLKDITYRAHCALRCHQIYAIAQPVYTDEYCCEGNSVNDLICLSPNQCYNLQSKFQHYVFKITLLCYISIAIVSCIICFGVIYAFTKEKQYKLKNAFFISVIIISAALIIPIMILYMIVKIKGMSLQELFGANLNSLSSYDFIEGVEIKENTRRIVANRKTKYVSGPHGNQILSNNNNSSSSSSHNKAIINEKPEIELKEN